MDAREFLKVCLGGNMNISTLKPLAWYEIMDGFAKHKAKNKNMALNEVVKWLEKNCHSNGEENSHDFDDGKCFACCIVDMCKGALSE